MLAPPVPALPRWERSGRFPWFDLGRLQRSRVVVIGAGALGNEVVKGLALSGVGAIDVVDPDRVDATNLNRCVFFRDADARARASKARTLASRAAELVPEARFTPFEARAEALPADFYEGAASAVLCVDNVAARLHVNARARAAGAVVVDGATQGTIGKVQVVWDAEDPCVECVTNATHREVLDERYACAGRPATLYAPPLAQEVTTTSVIAAIQAREAVKAALGLAAERLRGVFRYDGASCRSEVLALAARPQCPHHQGVR